MYLVVDNSFDDKCVIYFSLNTEWVQREFKRDNNDLLVIINQLLTEEGKKLSDLNGLAVVVGKGKFTATRIAVTMVNTLSYALKIPVLAVSDFYPEIKKDIKMSPIGQYVSAQYSAPANIGGVKK